MARLQRDDGSKLSDAPLTGRTPRKKPLSQSSKVASGLPISVLDIYRASPLQRIGMIKRGIPAAVAKQLFSTWKIGQGDGFKALNLSTATVNKKAKQDDLLSQDESERVVGFARLAGKVAAMIEESGDGSAFDASSWLARWLKEPLPALGGARPADLIDTMEGQGLVMSMLAKMQSGAYA